MADFAGPVLRALAEDQAGADVTTALIAANRVAEARFVTEERCVVCGVPAVGAAFPDAALVACIEEGSWAVAGATIAAVRGDARRLLSGERVALNFVQRLTGIATVTRRCVEAVAGTGAKITHTRKTTPGLRELEIYAVLTGGGVANRASLADAVMWKDNHWALARELPRFPSGIEVVVEVESFEQLDAALAAGVTHVLVDNKTPNELAGYRRRAGSGVTIQASGGITLATCRAYADAGADLIAMGCLTHSAPAAAIRCDLRVD